MKGDNYNVMKNKATNEGKIVCDDCLLLLGDDWECIKVIGIEANTCEVCEWKRAQADKARAHDDGHIDVGQDH